MTATPFDIRDWRQISYSPAELDALSSTLGDFLGGTLRRLGFATGQAPGAE